jgi:uncharacterized protein YpmB
LKKWIIILSVCTLVFVGYFIASIMVGMDDKNQAEERAIQIAESKGGLVEISDFYLYHGKETYSVVIGQDQEGTKQVLWIPENTKDQSVIKKKYSDGVSKTEITNEVKKEKQPKEIISVKLGMENKTALWEVTFKDQNDFLHYYYYDFLTGKLLRYYENI